MNIFVLSTSPRLCARYQCDAHVGKMLVEAGQLLSTYCRFNKLSRKWMYKSTHVNHPCSVWLREHSENVQWLIDFATELGHEFERRYGHGHKTSKIIACFVNLIGETQYNRPRRFAFVGPSRIKAGSVVARYRKLYRSKSRKMKVRWRHSTRPVWFRS